MLPRLGWHRAETFCRVLPEHPDRVLADQRVRGDDDQTFGDGLTNQYAVERILMQGRQFRDLNDRFLRHWQRLNAGLLATARYPDRRFLRQGQSSQRPLDGDLPNRNRTQIEHVLRQV